MKYLALLPIVLTLQGEPKNIAEYFNACPHKGDFTLKESEKNDVTVDLANAYIKVINHGTDDYAFDSEIAFVYFLTASKIKIFGISNIERGPNTDHFDCSFYHYDQGKWIDVTRDVLPDLGFEVFAGDKPGVENVGSQFQLEITLPQKGTSLVVEPHPVGETDNPFSDTVDGYRNYLQLFSQMPKSEKQLKWNKEKGVFEIVK